MQSTGLKKHYVSPRVEKLEFAMENIILTSAGNGDVGKGKGKGGGCDGVPYHENQRTFSNGKNSGC